MFVRAHSNLETSPPRALDAPEEGASTRDAGGTPEDRASFQQLTEEEQRVVEQLRSRDLEVRQHEAAHQAVGGELVGAASFTYQQGPDAKSYAIGGEVPISMRSGRTPDETISNARRVRAAALAPAEPSGQDLQVAAAASQMELQAMQQKRVLEEAQRRAETRGTHLHSSEPCLACSRDAAVYSAGSGGE